MKPLKLIDLSLTGLVILAAGLAVLLYINKNPSFTVLGPQGPEQARVGAWLDAHPMPAKKNLYPVELTRTARTSVSIVQISDAETYHIHAKHDLAVTLLRGRGVLKLEGKEIKMRAGDTVQIPAGSPHAFINKGSKPAAAWAVFSPPFDGKDTHPAGEM